MRRQILLIDDSAMLRRIAASVLHAQAARYEVVAATRPSEGFARACGGEVSVVLMDERLAGTGDHDLCRRLLDEPRTASLPIVLLTGRRADAPKLGSLPDNVVETLGKPFAPEQLAGVVNTISALANRGAGFGEMRQALHPVADATTTMSLTDQRLPPDASAQPNLAVHDFSIRAALQSATGEGRTGVLKFFPGDGLPTEVFFDDGRLLLVATRDGAAYSRDAAAALPAKVSPATLEDAAAEQSRTGIPFLLTLGARGLVSKGAGVELLRRFGQRYFARLWTVPTKSLRIEFETLEVLPGFTLRLEPVRETVDEWLLGTLRTLTSADIAAEASHQGFVGTPKLTRRGEAILAAVKLGEDERAFARQVDGRRDLPVIARNLGITPEAAFLLLYRFRCLEVLEYRPAPVAFVVTPRTSMRRVLPLPR